MTSETPLFSLKILREKKRSGRERDDIAKAELGERAQVTLNSIGDAVVCTEVSGTINYLNAAAERMTRWSMEEAIGKSADQVLNLLNATSREIIPNPVQKALSQNQTLEIPLNTILVRRDGTELPVEDSVAPVHDRNGQITGAVIVLRDVSAVTKVALKLAYSAQHDPLTGLPNRLLLDDRIRQAIARSDRHRKKVAVLFLDLDGFKHVNDSLGHAVGDELLRAIALRLAGCIRNEDTVSRLGGDEFVVLLSEVEQLEDAAIAARRMLHAVATNESVGQHKLHVTTSIGVSFYPDDGLDAETLIMNADIAMYQAKKNGRRNYQHFEPAMQCAGRPSRAVVNRQQKDVEETTDNAARRG